MKASNAAKGNQFGFAIALSADGNTLAVSAISDDSAAKGVNGVSKDHATNSGAVYVYTRDHDGWKQQAYLKASNTAEGAQFGNALSLSADGNVLAVGSTGEASSATGINSNQSDRSMSGAGAVYVFARAGAAWSQQAYLKASNTGGPDIGYQFGYSVSLSGDGRTLAVGGPATPATAPASTATKRTRMHRKPERCSSSAAAATPGRNRLTSSPGPRRCAIYCSATPSA